jgi:hypothetical protein
VTSQLAPAALLSAVYVDNKLEADSGVQGNKWWITDKLPTGNAWATNANFQLTSDWVQGYKETCPDRGIWGDWFARFKEKAPGSEGKLVWYPNCNDGGTEQNFKYNYLRLVIPGV